MSEGLTMNQLAERNATLITENADLQQKLDALSEFRSMIFGALGVHDSHEDFVARVNIENSLRRANCLSAIERHFTFEVEDEEYEGEMMEQCPLNWGQEPEAYIETFKSVLNSVRAEGVEMFGNSALCSEEMSHAVNEFAAQLRAGQEAK